MHSRAVAFVALLAIAGAAAFERPINGDCVNGASSGTSSVSLFPDEFVLPGGDKVEGATYVENAAGFSIRYFPTYKLVNNSIAEELYVLYQCGADAPAPADFPPGTKFFQIPLVSVVVPETVPYAALERLNLTDRVYSVPSYVTAPCGQYLLNCSDGSPRQAPDAYSGLDNVTLLEETVAAVSDAMLVTSPSDYPEAIAVSLASDPGVLPRAEWIKFLALFFNKEKEASQLYDWIQAQYQELKDETATEYKDPGMPNPVVAWVSHFSFPGYGDEYQISWAPYKKDLTRDAGADILSYEEVAAIEGVHPDDYDPESTLIFSWGTNTSFPSQQAALEALLRVLSKVDVVIDETFSFTPSLYDVAAFLGEYSLDEELAAAQPWFKNQRVFRTDGRLSQPHDGNGEGLDWFEGALMRPAQVLRDMVRAVHPEIAQKHSFASDFVWIRNLFTEAPVVVGPEQCTAPTSCDEPPVPICPFVSLCPGASSPALLKGTESGACIYEKCAA